MNEPTANEPTDYVERERRLLIEAQRRNGICSAPQCYHPIALWCTRCHGKMCAHHARVVQLLPDYRDVTLCYRCEPANTVIEDPAVIRIPRPDYDPTEETISEAHAAWWLADSTRRYIAMATTAAPALLLNRELDLIQQRAQLVKDARLRALADRADRADRDQSRVPEYVAFLVGRLQDSGESEDSGESGEETCQ